jgi:membrane associated rhomboid family serine protease
LIPLKDNIPTREFPVVTVVLIVANILVFVFFQQALFGPNGGFSSSGDQTRVLEYSFIPYELAHTDQECGAAEGQLVCGTPRALDRHGAEPGGDQVPVWVTIFTAMFMHGGVLHIAGNMLFLWIFGNNIEDAMGRLKFILFYLAGGVIASLAQYIMGPNEVVPTLGASGAIAAVLGGYALLYPRARVVTLIFIVFFVTVITLPALLVLGFWFVLQLLDAASQPFGGGGGVAYFAHIGGFIFGLLVIKLLANRYNPDYDRPQRLPVY